VKARQTQQKTFEEWKKVLDNDKVQDDAVIVKLGNDSFAENYKKELGKVKSLMKENGPFVLFKQVKGGVIVAGIGTPEIIKSMVMVLTEAELKMKELKARTEIEQDAEDDVQPRYVN
jgi:hypothetical protein